MVGKYRLFLAAVFATPNQLACVNMSLVFMFWTLRDAVDQQKNLSAVRSGFPSHIICCRERYTPAAALEVRFDN